MSEDIRKYAPRQLLQDVSSTWPGFLATAIDAILYGCDTKDGKFIAGEKVYCPEKHGGNDNYIDTRRTLAAARDLLEAIAFREVWNNNRGTMHSERFRQIAAKDEAAK